MLSIQKSQAHQEKFTLNILPCKISHNGRVNTSRKYWNPVIGKDGKNTAYFRGRKLHGRKVNIPKGYRGVIATSTERVVEEPKDEATEEEVGVEDELKVETKVLEEESGFADVVVWGHEVVPGALDDVYVKGMEEWISFAESIHAFRGEGEDALTS